VGGGGDSGARGGGLCMALSALLADAEGRGEGEGEGGEAVAAGRRSVLALREALAAAGFRRDEASGRWVLRAES